MQPSRRTRHDAICAVLAWKATHHVYVVLLDPAVLKHRRFVEANPGLSPKERFDNHKQGRKANSYVQRYGERLMPRKTLSYPSYDAALKAECRLADSLRKRGWAVWQG